MSKILTALFTGLLIFSSCKYRVHTKYKVEVTSTDEDLDGIHWAYKSSGVQSASETYDGDSTTWTKEFVGTSKCNTSITANCYDAQIEPHNLTIKIYRKGKLVKEGSGTGQVKVEFNNL